MLQTITARGDFISTFPWLVLTASPNVTWADMFKAYGIVFDIDGEESKKNGRDDPLGWALACARLVIAIITSHKEIIYEDEIYNI